MADYIWYNIIHRMHDLTLKRNIYIYIAKILKLEDYSVYFMFALISNILYVININKEKNLSILLFIFILYNIYFGCSI